MSEREATRHRVWGRETRWGWFSELAWGHAAGEVDVYMQISSDQDIRNSVSGHLTLEFISDGLDSFLKPEIM